MESDNKNNVSEFNTERSSSLNLRKRKNAVKIPSLDRFVAIDCEMVGVGEGGATR